MERHNELLNKIKNPYFHPSKNDSNIYLTGLLDSLNYLQTHLKPTDFDSLKKRKLQLFSENINEVQYFQAACELTVCSYFAKRFPQTFKYEPQPNPPKDVDCSYEENGYLFNIEVKCADFTIKNNQDKSDAYKISTLGRVENFSTVVNDMRNLIESSSTTKPLLVAQNMDNKLKDFLISAQSKFSNKPSNKTLNVLVVCCDNQNDIQKWFHYMRGQQGLFREDSFVSPSEYNKTDIVMLTNLYHRHFEYFNKSQIINHWNLENSFNLVCWNPFKILDKKDLITHFKESIPNFSQELYEYHIPDNGQVMGLDVFRIVSFVNNRLIGTGHFHFQKSAQSE